MAQLKIKYDDLDWEDEGVSYGAIYKGKKFTGIAIEEIGKNSYKEWSFLNGMLNGRNYFFDNKNGKVIQEAFYENGIPINTHFNWIGEHKHTKTYFQGELVIAKTEDNFGALLFEYDKEKMILIEWFKNGNKRSEKILISTGNLYQFTSEKFWNEKGIWLMTIKDKVFFEFNNTYLLAHSLDLNSEDEERIITLFSEQLLKEQIEAGVKYLQINTAHKNPFLRYQSAKFLSRTNDLKSLIFLEKLLADNLQPKTNLTIDWQGIGHSKKTEHTISKMAQIAIESINNNVDKQELPGLGD